MAAVGHPEGKVRCSVSDIHPVNDLAAGIITFQIGDAQFVGVIEVFIADGREELLAVVIIGVIVVKGINFIAVCGKQFRYAGRISVAAVGDCRRVAVIRRKQGRIGHQFRRAGGSFQQRGMVVLEVPSVILQLVQSRC